MRLGLIQLNAKLAAFRQNRLRIQSLAEEKEADLYICPELSLSGYCNRDLFHNPDFLKSQNLELTELMKWSEKKNKSIIIGAVIDGYNAAVLISNGAQNHKYYKCKLPNQNIFEEKRHFSNGNDLGAIFSLGEESFNVEICEDSWPSVQGFQIDQELEYLDKRSIKKEPLLINISASPFIRGKDKLRREMLSSRAKKDNCFFVYTNFSGAQDELVFDGQSSVYSPSGDIVLECPRFEEGIFICDTQKLDKAKKPISHSGNDTVEAIKMFVRDYLLKTGHQKVVLGVSGGVDSALCAALCCQAIGAENVLGISLPSKWTSNQTMDEIQKLQKNLGFELRTINISQIVEGIENAIQQSSTPLAGIACENLQARTRANVLMSVANNESRLLVATSNKSELAMGYSTLYGDMAGALLPIGDLYKTEVYEISHLLNSQEKKEVVPLSTINRQPSAELKENQKDTDSLPPYHVLDSFLYAYLEHHTYLDSQIESFEKLLAPYQISSLKRKVQINEFKRKQSGLICKVHHRSFGVHWQMPISAEPLV